MKRMALQVAFGLAMAFAFEHWPTWTVGFLAYCLLAEAVERMEQDGTRG